MPNQVISRENHPSDVVAQRSERRKTTSGEEQ